MLDSEQRRQQRTQQNIDALGELAQQLLALDLPRELRKPLKQFARDIEERARQSREIPILLSELSRLQRQALAERKGGDAEDGRPSLLQRLFGGKESETTAEPSASVPSVVAASNTPIQPAAAAPSLPVAEHDEAPGGPPQPLPARTVAAIESAPAGWVGEMEERISLKLSRSMSTKRRSTSFAGGVSGLPERSARMPTTRGSSFFSMALPISTS